MRTARSPIIVIAMTFMLMACGASQRQKTLSTAFAGINATSQAFTTWDAAHQTTIAQNATSLVAGREALTSYRESREIVTQAFVAAYQAVAAASLDENTPIAATLSTLAGLAEAIKDLQAP